MIKPRQTLKDTTEPNQTQCYPLAQSNASMAPLVLNQALRPSFPMAVQNTSSFHKFTGLLQQHR
jgi:hypothetical protein